jgi:hypothetical protein
MRIKKVIGVGAMVGGIGIAAAACSPVNVHWEKYPTGTSATLRTAEQHWWVNGGGDAALTVNKAQAAASTDAYGSASLSTDRADGRALERAAQAAARNPYPGNPAAYGALMSDLAAAGQYLSTGDTSDARAEFCQASAEAGSAGWSTDFPAVPANLTS